MAYLRYWPLFAFGCLAELEHAFQNISNSASEQWLSHTKRSARRKRQAPGTVWPEVLLVVDYDSFMLHGATSRDVKRYFISFWNGVDLRYKLLAHPQIRVSLAGMIVAKVNDSTQDVMFIEFDFGFFLTHPGPWRYSLLGTKPTPTAQCRCCRRCWGTDRHGQISVPRRSPAHLRHGSSDHQAWHVSTSVRRWSVQPRHRWVCLCRGSLCGEQEIGKGEQCGDHRG